MENRNKTTLSNNFEVVVPEAICRARHWQAGQEFVFLPKGEGLLLIPVPDRDSLHGMARHARTEGFRDRNGHE
ncbi:AbrB/MazE/SpoVT family DNA-binding domain-containing protein [Radicibacter daui]|uniref:AbrB/MazE/SpoVT family DNA-binding domain-containing protein n=1 Tax=Radicibacter daui TaxID=3064829 RepID=UPI004046AEAE